MIIQHSSFFSINNLEVIQEMLIEKKKKEKEWVWKRKGIWEKQPTF